MELCSVLNTLEKNLKNLKPLKLLNSTELVFYFLACFIWFKDIKYKHQAYFLNLTVEKDFGD